MGRRKPFIDKKSATTYSLLYDDTDEAGEEASPNGSGQGAQSGSGRPDHSAIIAQLQGRDEAPVLQLPEVRRREITDLGFPDDGYDYLKHLKEGKEEHNAFEDGEQRAASQAEGENTVQRLRAPDVRWLLANGSNDMLCMYATPLSFLHICSAPAASGPRVFLPAPFVEPPPADVKVIDARRLPPQQEALDEVSPLQKAWSCSREGCAVQNNMISAVTKAHAWLRRRISLRRSESRQPSLEMLRSRASGVRLSLLMGVCLPECSYAWPQGISILIDVTCI